MIKASQLKESFETISKRLISWGGFSCCLGVKKLHHLTIAVVSPSAKRTFIALRAYYTLNDYVVIARSYPMSFESAHRLVCSL